MAEPLPAKVALLSGARSSEPMGLALAETRLIEALRDQVTDASLEVRVVGGRGARRYAKRLEARWVPGRPGNLPKCALRGAALAHLLGLDLPPPSDTPFVTTVHDLAPLIYDDEGELPPWLDEVVSRSSLFLTPSAFTAGELTARLGVSAERIRVFGGAPALRARDAEPLTTAELAGLGINAPYALRLGGYTTRKNVPLLLEAWANVSSGTLVLAGPPQDARAAILAKAPSLDRVLVLDYVTQPLLARLLRSASALVTTSLYEGFGLPPLEALAAGTPVVALSSVFVQEICGEAALLVVGGPVELAEAVASVLSDRDLANTLRTRGFEQAAKFTWSRAAGRVVLAYEEEFRKEAGGTIVAPIVAPASTKTP